MTDKILDAIKSLQLYGGDVKAIVSYAKRIANENLPDSDAKDIGSVGLPQNVFFNFLLVASVRDKELNIEIYFG